MFEVTAFDGWSERAAEAQARGQRAEHERTDAEPVSPFMLKQRSVYLDDGNGYRI